MRKRINEIIEPSKEGDKASLVYDIMMLLAITVSIIPLMFVEDNKLFRITEAVTVTIFIIDYILRWITADCRLQKKEMSFALYPFTGWAIIDLLSILPGLSLIGRGFKILRITRLMRILRLFKFIRYSNKFQVLGRVIRKERRVLLSVLGIAVFYVFLTALIMFNVEPRDGQCDFRRLFRRPVLGDRDPHYRRVWGHGPDYRRRAFHQHALITVRSCDHRVAFRCHHRQLP